MKSQKIGIYLGAFDPIHDGHLNFAKAAIEKNKLDRLYFLVEPSPKHKQGVKALNHRINMVMLGVQDSKIMGTIVIKSRIDIEQYLPILQKRFLGHKLYLIIPEKDVPRFIKWPSLISLDHTKLNLAIGVNESSSSDIPGKLELLSQTSGVKLNHQIFECENKPNQTNEVRRKLKKGEKPQDVPESVYNYINEQSLYVASA